MGCSFQYFTKGDDNPHARKALSAFFSMQDWLTVVGVASNGEEALEKNESQIPDIILMDAQMPVMDGMPATQIIKSRWSQIKVIILTIYSSYKSLAQPVGAYAFLVKGCSPEMLTSTLCSLN